VSTVFRADIGMPQHAFVDSSEVLMRENEERWKKLCRQAFNEQDPQKLLELTKQICALMNQRLPNEPPNTRSAAD
jgi:hypothetical protein